MDCVGKLYETECGRQIMCLKYDPPSSHTETRPYNGARLFVLGQEYPDVVVTVQDPAKYHFVNVKNFEKYVYNSLDSLKLLTSGPTHMEILSRIQKKDAENNLQKRIREKQTLLTQTRCEIRECQTRMSELKKKEEKCKLKCDNLEVEITGLKGEVPPLPTEPPPLSTEQPSLWTEKPLWIEPPLWAQQQHPGQKRTFDQTGWSLF